MVCVVTFLSVPTQKPTTFVRWLLLLRLFQWAMLVERRLLKRTKDVHRRRRREAQTAATKDRLLIYCHCEVYKVQISNNYSFIHLTFPAIFRARGSVLFKRHKNKNNPLQKKNTKHQNKIKLYRIIKQFI